MPRRLATLAVVLLAAACGGKPAPAPAPPAAKSEAPPAPPPTVLADEPAGEPAPPPSGPKAAMYARLLDDGPVPGVTGYTQKRERSGRHCGGERVSIGRGADKLDADQEAIAAMYRIEFPTGLDFSPLPEHKARKEASMKKFQAWLANATKVGADGTRAFEAKLTAATSPQEKAEYAARIGQISMRMASILARAEIPKDVRTGEFAADKIDAFCDSMFQIAEPLIVRAGEAFKVCGGAAAPKAWFAPLCSAP